jgi:hypothetical protein
MPFEREDFFVGMIAYFTVNELRRHARIRTTAASMDMKVRPFVCYAEDRGTCYWTAMTKTDHRMRKKVDRRHLRHAVGRFLDGRELIIYDGRSTFAGSIDDFCALSKRHDDYDGYRRPFLSREGVEQVRWIVAAKGGMVPAADPAMRPVMQPMVLAAA